MPDSSGRTVIAVSCRVGEDANLCGRSLSWLSPDEQARAARFRFDRDRCAYVAAHFLLRRCLQRVTGRSDWDFRTGAFGKPELFEPFGALPLRFNLTHTAGLVACALVHGHDVGIDAEAVDRKCNYLELAQRFFTTQEVEDLGRRPAEARGEAFLAIWTAKEAVIKATGQGLRMPLDSFSVDSVQPRVAFRDGSGEWDERWVLHRCRLSDHHLALAVRAAPGLSRPERIEWRHSSWVELFGPPHSS
jgi:4'-phosphopantetheinyl transferase